MIRPAIAICILVFCSAAFSQMIETQPRNAASFRDWRQRYTDAAKQHDFRLAAAPDERLEMTPEPVLSYSHPSGLKGTHGTFYVWTKDERPQVVGSIWSFEDKDGRRGLNHELHSLATGALVPIKIGTAEWSSKVGIEPTLIPQADEPAETARLRLAQMRALAKRFQGYSNTVDNQEGRLRTLPQPMYRGNPNSDELLDCALFGLFADWDPEILLLIEARRAADGFRWHFSAGRFNICRMRLAFDGVDIWQQDDAPQAFPTFGDPQGPFFAVHSVEIVREP